MTSRVFAVLGVGLVDPDAPVLAADDLGVDRGDGCFEGVGLRTDGSGATTVLKLDAHLARFHRSAAAMEIPLDEPAWRELIGQAVEAWTEPGEAVMRLLLTRGRPGAERPTGLLTIKPAPPTYALQRRDGVAVVTLAAPVTADAYTDAPWLLGGVKTLSYAVNMAAYREAVRRGADDVIFVGRDGRVLEGPTSTVMWSDGETLWTVPVGANGILPGTTQQLIFANARAAGRPTAEAQVTVPELHAASSLWIVSSGRGPVDVVRLDGEERGRDVALTAELMALAGL